MNLFSARLSGKMVSTEQFEKDMEERQKTVVRFRQVEKTAELAEYFQLKKIVETPQFQEKKKELQSRRYKDTEEGRKTAHYNKLNSSLRMRGYKRALEIPNFVNFLKFRDSEEYSKIKDPKERRKSSELRLYNTIDRSAFYQNYLKVLNSEELKQLQALEKEMATDDFKKRNDFWKNEKRWLETEEYKQEKRYLELAASDDIKFYLNQKKEDIDWAEMFRPTFADDMSSSKNWKPGYGYKAANLKDGHSQANEKQAYNNGKNTIFAEGRMDIETRTETKTATAWDAKKGFIEKVFSYTSDVMNTKDVFAQQEGMFMAKVRSQGAGHHFFGLTTGDNKDPKLALYHFDGKTHKLGVIGGNETKQVPLTGVLRSMYHVYTLRWTKHEIVWYVNNLEVLRTNNNIPQEKMFLLAQSFLPEKEKAGEGKLKVAWVRVFRSVEK